LIYLNISRFYFTEPNENPQRVSKNHKNFKQRSNPNSQEAELLRPKLGKIINFPQGATFHSSARKPIVSRSHRATMNKQNIFGLFENCLAEGMFQ
jgi:hypothetical protein